jgi:alkylated DNA nucleotide flippase Atl1
MDFHHAYELRGSDAAVIDDPVDHMEPIEDEPRELNDALMRIVLWMHSSKEAANIGARAMVLAVSLNIDLEHVASYASIARSAGLTREAVRLMAKELEVEFGLRTRNSRTDATRQRCKDSRKRVLVNREIAPQ